MRCAIVCDAGYDPAVRHASHGTGCGTRRVAAGCLLATLACAGCDPIFEIDGAFFPAWLVCMVLAVGPLLLVRWAMRKWAIEEHARPVAPTYISVYVASVLLLWLGIYRT